jgi:PAS domain S-box-containing protein
VEYEERLSDGGGWLENRVVPLAGGAVTYSRNVSERKQREARFRRRFVDNPLPTWIVDAEALAFLDVNEAATRCYGYTRDEVLASTVARVLADGAQGAPSLGRGTGRHQHHERRAARRRGHDTGRRVRGASDG